MAKKQKQNKLHIRIHTHTHMLLQSYLTLGNPVDCSLPGSTVHGLLQTRILKWVAMPSSGGSSPPRDWICVSCVFYTGKWVLCHYIHRGAPQRHDTQRNDQRRQLLYLLDKETINLWRINKTNELGLGVINCWRSNKVCFLQCSQP